ncbi:putative variant cofactor biosynthesis B12-binding domain/radical SAM domain protein 1 [Desulfocicer vacuolatum DSM 3385]|uniref:Putative variant cofactor biosynthesis B12-binding domain/radical SAM domain protein 1 n=2 Tax=Desulfocicer vacuolatum TaxID=2298 RepID=A0A1W2AZB5_9BACT|nr:putative variant cofactor biosynthesis B12-binding domain/radical SAM domain protein 1 [Desulfocicer vacuolatum DSM 3385]
MKILLVQLPTSHLGAGEKVYPLGLSRLSGTVPDSVEKKVLDMNICVDPWPALNEALTQQRPDVVALSFRNLDPLAGHQASYLSSLKTAALVVKNQLPDVRVLAGGPAFSLFARRLMEEVPQLDVGLKGEGELIFPLLVQPDPDYGSIPGIIWRDGGELVLNPPGARIDMDTLPPMDLGAFPPLDYTHGNAYVAAMGIEGKRGCDLWCGYCLYPFLGGNRMRLRSPVKIVDEMELLHKDAGIKLFHFTDGVLNRPADHFEALCRELIRRNLDFSWTGFFREDSLTRDNLDLAKKAGVVAVYFSGDALTDHGLELLNKKMTREDILKASRLTAEQGVLTMCHFLVNLPGETENHVKEARQMLDELLAIHHAAGNLGAVIFNHIRLYPGAPVTQKLIRDGHLDPETDLLYPVYHNPARGSHLLHEFEARCHSAGVFSRLKLDQHAMEVAK